jgi:hypothetical protein
MNHEIDDIRRALGIPGEVRIETVGRFDLPPPTRGWGRQARAATVTPTEPERLADVFRQRAFGFSAVPVSGPEPDVGELVSVDELPGLFLLRTEGRAVVRSGRWDAFDDTGELALDARAAPVIVRIEGDRALHVLRLTATGWIVVRVFERAAALEEALARTRAPRAPGIDLPPVPAAVTGPEVSGWLRQAALRRISSADPLDRAAGVGVVLRLWTPADPDETGRLLGVDRAVAGTPDHAAADWARSLTDEAREGLLRAAADLLDEVAGSLEILSDLVVAEDAAAESVAAHLVTRRDDIESILALLRAARDGERAGALAEDAGRFDEDAATRLSAFLAVELPALTELLSAVAWQEPDAWWGALARFDG